MFYKVFIFMLLFCQNAFCCGNIAHSILSHQFVTLCHWITEKLKASNTPSIATTFFFKKDGTDFTLKQKETCYEAMLQHEFPMAPWYNAAYNGAIDETVAIQKAIAKRWHCRKVQAVFIPTTLYQLIHALFFKKKERDGFEIVPKVMDDFLPSNTCSEVVDEFWEFNDFLITFLQSRGINYQNGLKQNEVERLVSDIWDHHRKCVELDFVPGTRYQKRIFVDKLSKEVLFNAIAIEYESKKSGTLFVLYRGNGRWQFPEFSEYSAEDFDKYQNGIITDNLKKFNYVSVSYSSALFSGLYFDPGACAGYLMQGDNPDLCDNKYYIPNNGYALLIDKKLLTSDPTSSDSLFIIPPLIPLVGLYSKGEFFHPRSKIVVGYETSNESIKIKGFSENSTTLQKVTDIPLFYYRQEKQPTETMRKLLLFIINGAISLTNDTKRDLQALRVQEKNY